MAHGVLSLIRVFLVRMDGHRGDVERGRSGSYGGRRPNERARGRGPTELLLRGVPGNGGRRGMSRGHCEPIWYGHVVVDAPPRQSREPQVSRVSGVPRAVTLTSVTSCLSVSVTVCDCVLCLCVKCIFTTLATVGKCERMKQNLVFLSIYY